MWPRQLAAAMVAVSFAAHRLLTERYEFATGADVSRTQFDAVMVSLCHDPAEVPPAGSPAWVGIEIADRVLAFGADDGALEQSRYVDLGYQSVNPLGGASGAEPIDIGPGARGNKALGRTDGVGHARALRPTRSAS